LVVKFLALLWRRKSVRESEAAAEVAGGLGLIEDCDIEDCDGEVLGGDAAVALGVGEQFVVAEAEHSGALAGGDRRGRAEHGPGQVDHGAVVLQGCGLGQGLRLVDSGEVGCVDETDAWALLFLLREVG
jgi:hypothetical protein